MSLLETKAAAICAKLEENPNFKTHFGVDPAPPPVPSPHPFLDFIMQLLQQLLPTILGCFKTPLAVHAAMQRPSLLVRLAGRRQIRNFVGADPNNAEEQMSVHEINNAMLSVAKDTTAEEFTQLFA